LTFRHVKTGDTIYISYFFSSYLWLSDILSISAVSPIGHLRLCISRVSLVLRKTKNSNTLDIPIF